MSDSGNGARVDMNETGLKVHDMKLPAVVFMIFCLCSAGAYGIEDMIPAAGPGLTMVMLLVLPFVWSTPLGLVASELGSARPQEGGYYKWVQEALGEFWGFQSVWWRTISVYIDNTLYIILAGGYLQNEFGLSGNVTYAIKVAIIIFFTYINIRGIKDVGIISTILSILVIFAFALVTVCGFMNWHSNPFIPFTADGTIMGIHGIGFSDWVTYIGAGIAVGIWMYSGYEGMSTVAGEVSNPQLIPKATMIAVPLIVAVYIFPTLAGIASLGQWQNWGTTGDTLTYSNVVETFWGKGFGVFFVIVAFLAQCSIYNPTIASASRGFFALAEDHLAPPLLVRCDKKHGVPYIAVLSVGITNLILCMFAFDVVVVVDVFLLIASYIMIFISAMILRRRIPSEEYKFRIPGGFGFLCVICIVPMFIAVAAFFINGTDYFIGGMIGIVSGPILYFIWKHLYGGLSKKDAQLFPKNPKTGLALGDTRRMSLLFIILAVMGTAGSYFLPWFEGSGANAYYFETYGIKGFFDTMMNWIHVATVVAYIIAIVFLIVSIIVEPKKATKEISG